MSTASSNSKAPEGAHDWRISLNLTRRVVRRMIERANTENSRFTPPSLRPTNVPDPTSYRTSLRLLRRTLRRMIEQAECLMAPDPAPTLTPARCPVRRG